MKYRIGKIDRVVFAYGHRSALPLWRWTGNRKLAILPLTNHVGVYRFR